MDSIRLDSPSDASIPSEDPRSTSASPPHTEDDQNDWGLSYHDEYPEDLDFSSKIWNNPAGVSALGQEEGPGEKRVLCTTCHKNLVAVHEVMLSSRKKRKRQDDLPVLSSMTVYKECATLHTAQLRAISVPEKSKRVVKRERAKSQIDQESESMTKLKDKQLELLEKCKDLSDVDRRRMQQMGRNRISALQSRDRKKMYMAQMEDVNQELSMENQRLGHKIEALEQENNYLRSQLERYTAGGSSLLRMTGGITLGLAAIVMVIMVVQHPAPVIPVIPVHPTRVLSSSTSVMEYKGVNSLTVPESHEIEKLLSLL